MAPLEEIKAYRRNAISRAAYKIETDNAESVAVMFFVLDCGCMRVCGASANADPVWPFIKIAGYPPNDKAIFICPKCIKDKRPSDRIIYIGLLSGKENTMAKNEEFRQTIFQKIIADNFY